MNLTAALQRKENEQTLGCMEITVEYLLSWPPLSQSEAKKCRDPNERVHNLSAARPV